MRPIGQRRHAKALAALLAAVATSIGVHLAAVAPAHACSGWYPSLGPLPGREWPSLFFEADGALWFHRDEEGWVRIAADGSRRTLRLGRWSAVRTDGRFAFDVGHGMGMPSCEFDWIRVDRIDLEAGVRTAMPRIGPMGGLGFIVSPDAGRAVVAGAMVDLGGDDYYEGGLVMDFEARRLDPIEVEAVRWLDDRRLIDVSERGIRILDVEAGTAGPTVGLPEGLEYPEFVPGGMREDAVYVHQDDDSGEEGWRIYRVPVGEALGQPEPSAWTAHGELIEMSQDGRLVVVSDFDRVALLSTETGEPVAELPLPEEVPWVKLSFSPDSGRLVLVLNQRALCLDATSGAVLATVRLPFDERDGLMRGPPLSGFSEDGRRGVVGREGAAEVLDAASGRTVARASTGDHFYGAALSPDGRRLALVTRAPERVPDDPDHPDPEPGPPTLHLFDLETGERQVPLGGEARADLARGAAR